MLQVFKLIWEKIGVYIAIAGAALISLFAYGQTKKRQGASELRDKINKETQDVQKKWDEVDRRSTSVDDALDRLSGNGKN